MLVTKKIINPNDIDLFRQTVGEVRTVKSDKIQLNSIKPKPFPKKQHHAVTEVFSDIGELDIDPVSHEETLNYTAFGIQKNVLAKLRKGFFGVQAELDLHGLTSHVAQQQLSDFINASTQAYYRCIHIIHGKGYRSSETHPVLKNHLNRWLRQHHAVQAFCSAPQRQGGAGAVYVLLKVVKDHDEFNEL